MKRILSVIFILIFTIQTIFARQITAKGELEMFGKYLSEYYVVNFFFPDSLDELSKIFFLTENTITNRIEADKNFFNISIIYSKDNEVLLQLIDKTSNENCIYRLIIRVSDKQEFMFYKDGKLYETYECDLSGNRINTDVYSNINIGL